MQLAPILAQRVAYLHARSGQSRFDKCTVASRSSTKKQRGRFLHASYSSDSSSILHIKIVRIGAWLGQENCDVVQFKLVMAFIRSQVFPVFPVVHFGFRLVRLC